MSEKLTDVDINGSAATSTSLDLAALEQALSSSSTRIRISQLHHVDDAIRRNGTGALQLCLAGLYQANFGNIALDDSTISKILELLLATQPRYGDRESRLVVQKCLSSIIEAGASSTLLEPVVKALRQEAQKPAIASSSAFVLLEWCSLLMQHVTVETWSQLGNDILLAEADAIEKSLQIESKSGVARSAIVVARRGFRKLFSSTGTCQQLLEGAVCLLTTKISQPTAKRAVILGIIAGVCARQATLRSTLERLKPKYHDFYSREIIASRTVLPKHIALGLADFFSSFTSIEDVENELVPSIEKGLLRAPEIVLTCVVLPLVSCLSPQLDLSKTLDSKLLKPLLTNVKSSNPTIRSEALSAFRAIVVKCADSNVFEHVVDEVATPLVTGKLPTAEQRTLHSEMLEVIALSASSATKLLTSLSTISAKEGNEAALAAETSAMVHAAIINLKSGEDLPKLAVDVFVKGLADKKPLSKKLWMLRVGQILQALKDVSAHSGIAAFADAVIPKLIANFQEVTLNAASAAQNGLVVGAYILTALQPGMSKQFSGSPAAAALAKASISSQALSLAAKQSFLLNHRVYNKLNTAEDLRWLLQALSSAAEFLDDDTDATISQAWTEAVIYLVAASIVPPKIQQEAMKTISRLYAKEPRLISRFVVNGLWSIFLLDDAKEKDLKIDRSSLVNVIRSICLHPHEALALGKQIDQEILEAQACSLLVICRPELVPRSSWIDLCLRIGVDPGSLAEKHLDQLLQEIDFRSTLNRKHGCVQKAAYNSAAELAFVAPNIVLPRLMESVRHDLDPKQLEHVGPVEAAIFRTPEGTCFVDVLAKKSQNAVPNKNTKDYDILKWEDDLRSQLEQKKGQQRKLSAEETSKVHAQMQKESQIRKSIQEVKAKLLRGIGIIESLATGPPTDAALWLGSAVDLVLNIIDAGAGLIAGDVAQSAYIVCSQKISLKLGPVRQFVGVAALRLRGITLAGNYDEEKLEDLVTRVMYRLRFASEQRPFDTVSLIYIIPLVLDILREGGVGNDADDRDAQLVLAIEFLTFHTDVCADEAVPREQILSVLIESMQRYAQHYKLVKDCFADMCRCMAPNMSHAEMKVVASGVIVPQASVRTSLLQSISSEIDMTELGFLDEIWLACHDDEEENRELGLEIWEESGFSVNAQVPMRMMPYLENQDSQLRRAAARSLAEALQTQKGRLSEVIAKLQSMYVDLAKPRVQLLDEYGMPKKMNLSDPWEARQGIASAFKELSALLSSQQVEELFDFLIESGPLGDKSDNVRGEMLDAAIAATAIHGKDMIDAMMKKFEKTLEQPDQNSSAADRVNEAIIIIYGALARHLAPGDPKIPVVIERLLSTLSTPSETVQFAIAECLPPLVKACSDHSSKYFDQVLDELMTSKKYASQRGAAYGLAGLVLGRGIASLREYRIMSTLKSAMDNKKEANQREAALLAFELLSAILGRLFEPYVLQIVPQLLSGFGDSNSNVRDACLAAAKACFGQLSSYGVKQILPTLLGGLDDQQWRSKRGACDLLGAMAYLDPNQLANSLPDIIPPLTGVLNDSHKEVRAAANRSLKRFGEVITNPEIKSLVEVLLKALSDPTKHTDEALDSLIKVQFVHYLDAPSLALITRILQRGLDDRSNTKRKAAQVIGSLAHLTEKKDIVTHLPILVTGLKVAAVDPVPTTRATASRALGSLVEKLGEDAMPDLIPGLMQTLKSDSGAGDRLGSAQALSEVLAGLGTTRLEETLPTILQNVESAKPAVREGFMSLFIFLPVCFGNSFSNYLGRIVPSILAGLADDVESIRETALRAGRLLVKNFAARAVDLLLPELERGLADDSYRIRLSSVELVGDLLFNLTGVKGNAEGDEDDDEAAKEAGASLKEVLGEEKRNKILSALYVCRCDTAGAVRAAAVAVWKVLVHSPRILKELVPTLTQLLIRRLGSSNMEHKVIASNALGELIRKAGDGVLSSLLPTLEEGLQISTDPDAKQGICLALRELISSASPEAMEDHEKTLISVVRTALTDSDEEVREAAAEAFDSLQQILGKRAVDQVLPYLLNLLRSDEEAENALSALLTLLTETTRSNIILPNLIPTLTKPPISAFDAKALASLSKVAGAAMNRRLPGIINSLLDNEISCKEDSLRADLETSFDTVIQSIDEYDGLNTVMNVLLSLLKHEDHKRRAATARHLSSFFASATVDYSRYNQDIIRSLLNLFDDHDLDVVKASWAALSEFTKTLKKEEMESLVVSTRQTLLRIGVVGANLRGFELPKGINAILPIFLQGLMNGTADQRVQAALGISDIVDRTSEASLKPFVTQITGPLIRVVSERATEVKAAILLTLNNLLEKMPMALKPFLPQLQRTFAKSLADASSDVLRSRAAKALGTLIKYTPRIDPLIAELVTGSKTSDPGVKTAMLKALYEVISRAGGNMGEASRAAVLSLIDMDADARDETMTMTNAKLLGALIKNVPAENASSLLKNRVLTTHFSNFSILALNAVLVESPEVLMHNAAADELPELLRQGMNNKSTFVADASILATGKVLLTSPPKSFDSVTKIFDALAGVIQPGKPTDSRRLALVVIRTVSRANMELVRPHVPLLAAPIFAGVRDAVIPVKLAAEAAFVELFSVVDEESRVFDKFITGAGAELPANTKRSMTDYFRRVATRLGAQARERREAEGGQGSLGLSNDEQEDEREVWSVGRLEAASEAFA